jgi:hypothetical protein
MNSGFGRGGGFGAGRGGGRGMTYRRGWNQGAGWGRGWRGRTAMPPDVQVENRPVEHTNLQTLLERVNQLQAELSDIQETINKLEST